MKTEIRIIVENEEMKGLTPEEGTTEEDYTEEQLKDCRTSFQEGFHKELVRFIKEYFTERFEEEFIDQIEDYYIEDYETLEEYKAKITVK